jgi:hypothetical protein
MMRRIAALPVESGADRREMGVSARHHPTEDRIFCEEGGIACFPRRRSAQLLTVGTKMEIPIYTRGLLSLRFEREGRNLMNVVRLVGIYSETAARILLSCLVLTLPFPALAVLGDTAASVLNDQARMKGTLRSVDNRTYVMHEITSPSGSVVREFVSPQGAVFGVAWEGQFPPDLQQLLGPYYQQAQQAQAAAQQAGSQQPRQRRAPIVIETPGLVLYQTGHKRSFHGQAYIPQLVPQGVQASDIH